MPGQISWFDQHGVPPAAIVIFYGVALAFIVGALIGKQDLGVIKTPDIAGPSRIVMGIIGVVAFWACLSLGGIIPSPGNWGSIAPVIPDPDEGVAESIPGEFTLQ